jgi:hypothetical protein
LVAERLKLIVEALRMGMKGGGRMYLYLVTVLDLVVGGLKDVLDRKKGIEDHIHLFLYQQRNGVDLVDSSNWGGSIMIYLVHRDRPILPLSQ